MTVYVSCSYLNRENKIVIKTTDIKQALNIERQLLGLENTSNIRHSHDKPRFRDKNKNYTVKYVEDINEITQKSIF